MVKSLTKTLASLSLVGALALTGCNPVSPGNKEEYIERTTDNTRYAVDLRENRWFIKSYDANGLPESINPVDAGVPRYVTLEYAKKNNLQINESSIRTMTPGIQEALIESLRGMASLNYEFDKAWFEAKSSRTNNLAEAQK